MKISDLITAEILKLIEESEHHTAEIQRNELASILGCAPSQINYVLSSRFTPEHGFIIESQRGGGGYIRIQRVVMRHSSALMHIINSIGSGIDNISAKILIENCLQSGIMEPQIAKLTYAAISNNVMRQIPIELRDNLRATILKELLLAQI